MSSGKNKRGTTFLDVVLKPEIYWRFRPQLALLFSWVDCRCTQWRTSLCSPCVWNSEEKKKGTGLSNKNLETSETSTFLREADGISMMFVRQFFGS
jgi:hypothetical protein